MRLGSETSTSKTTEPLELDPLDVNDIIAALDAAGFTKFIVLEDFHYLPEETQRDFSVALKAFHEQSSLCFIVVGVWLDENRLIGYNGDLTERLIAVNADAWSREQLSEVIAEGEQLLNVRIDPTFRQDLLDGCLESVSVVQEACHKICASAGVAVTAEKTVAVGEGIKAAVVIHDVVEKQSARYNSFLQDLAAGFQPTDLKCTDGCCSRSFARPRRHWRTGSPSPTYVRRFRQAIPRAPSMPATSRRHSSPSHPCRSNSESSRSSWITTSLRNV